MVYWKQISTNIIFKFQELKIDFFTMYKLAISESIIKAEQKQNIIDNVLIEIYNFYWINLHELFTQISKKDSPNNDL